MAHLSTAEHPWGKPYTNKRYIHPPLAENIITMWPTSMVMIGEIPSKEPQHHLEHEKFGWFYGVCTEDSAAVVFTLKRQSDLRFRQRANPNYQNYVWDHDLMPMAGTRYHTRQDGIPIHSFQRDMDAVIFREEAFCDSARVPTAYIKVTLENKFGFTERIELGALARRGKEFLFTGCNEPDGYDGYYPTRERFLAAEKLCKSGTVLTDGRYKLYFDEKEPFSFEGENDITLALTLAPYERKTLTFAFTRSAERPLSYAAARRACIAFWKNELKKAKFIPNAEKIKPLFYNLLAQMLQMLARPHGADYTVMRQGGTQRYHWPEAAEMVRALALIGGYSDYMDAGLAHYFEDLQVKEGEDAGKIFYSHVPWNSRTAAALQMFSAAVESDARFYEKYIDRAMLGFEWMERERARSARIEGAVAGLFPPGIATDNHFPDAQQWTFADAAMLRGYEALAACLKAKQSPLFFRVQAAYEEYFGVMKAIFDRLAREQEESEFLYLPRDPKNDPALEERLNKDPFGYMFPNTALAIGLAGYGTREGEKVIHTYSHGGQAKNGLIYPCYRSTTGMGRTWYTTWAEMDRYRYYQKSGEREKCRQLIDALLKYNVTAEYYQCERIDDHDAYVAPWMPNASANGRLLQMLFDYYGAASL